MAEMGTEAVHETAAEPGECVDMGGRVDDGWTLQVHYLAGWTADLEGTERLHLSDWLRAALLFNSSQY
jgi:hypothetical protein